MYSKTLIFSTIFNSFINITLTKNPFIIVIIPLIMSIKSKVTFYINKVKITSSYPILANFHFA